MKKIALLVSVCIFALLWTDIVSMAQAGDKKVGVMWVGKSSMAKRNYDGFSVRIKKVAPDVKVTLKREVPTTADGEAVLRDFEKTQDAIVVIRSNGAELLAKLDPKPTIPCFVGGTTDPVALGVLQNMKKPEGNFTGVTYFVPFDKIFNVITACFPDLKSVGFLGEQGHPGTAVDRKGTRAECEKRGIAYYEAICSDSAEVKKAAAELVKKADILLVSNQALINRNVTTILQVTNKTKTPIVSYVETPVKIGAVLGISVDHVKMGKWLADSVADVLVKGMKIADVPVKSEPNPGIVVNEIMVKELGLSFPASIMQKAKLVK
jgi:putative ABC transport system substrate-binding protein